MGVPLCVICHFSLVAFSILSLSLIFVSVITMYLGVFLLGFILPGTFCASWTWSTISFPVFGKFSAITSSNISQVLLLFSFWDPYNANIRAFNQFTFKVIIEMYDPITIFLIALGLFSVGMSFPSLSSCLEKFL